MHETTACFGAVWPAASGRLLAREKGFGNERHACGLARRSSTFVDGEVVQMQCWGDLATCAVLVREGRRQVAWNAAYGEGSICDEVVKRPRLIPAFLVHPATGPVRAVMCGRRLIHSIVMC